MRTRTHTQEDQACCDNAVLDVGVGYLLRLYWVCCLQRWVQCPAEVDQDNHSCVLLQTQPSAGLEKPCMPTSEKQAATDF